MKTEGKPWRAGVAGLLLLLLLLVGSADGQVAVYNLEFEKEPNSINFSFFNGGFLVYDPLAETGSFLFTFYDEDSGKNRFVSAPDSAEGFVAIKKGLRKVVVRATAETGTALSHYLLIGEITESVTYLNRGQKVRLEIARFLKGQLVASDDESDVEFPAEDGTLGFAGTAALRASLDRPLTTHANAAAKTGVAVVEELIEALEAGGFVDADEPEEDADGDGTDANGEGTEAGTL